MPEKPSLRAPKKTQQQALDLINATFPPEAGLYKKGIILTSRSIVLYFHFPVIAERKYADEIEQLQSQTPWRIEVNPDPHQQELLKVVHRCVPESWQVLKPPSVRTGTSKVVVQVGALGSATEVMEARKRFLEETGFVLQFEEFKGAHHCEPEGSGAGCSRKMGHQRRLPEDTRRLPRCASPNPEGRAKGRSRALHRGALY